MHAILSMCLLILKQFVEFLKHSMCRLLLSLCDCMNKLVVSFLFILNNRQLQIRVLGFN